MVIFAGSDAMVVVLCVEARDTFAPNHSYTGIANGIWLIARYSGASGVSIYPTYQGYNVSTPRSLLVVPVNLSLAHTQAELIRAGTRGRCIPVGSVM